ncbi:MAG: (d)CMP kinase [Verrucomicrobia bacterium]|nr:(d)CMP kinase [Verrucomicrobiota bacterium]
MITSPAPCVIAIDGPAASGKSSVARALARRLGFAYVNSGAFYRVATACVLARGIDPTDADAVAAALGGAEVIAGLRAENGGESFLQLDGHAPTEEALRAAAVNAGVSAVASVPAVRALLTARLRALAEETAPASGFPGTVMEGRDIGSAVFPHTPFKFYIDASAEVRAQRRAAQGGGQDEIAARDRTDSTRRASPLLIAEDAHVIDSSRLTIDGVVGEIIGRLKLKGFAIAS